MAHLFHRENEHFVSAMRGKFCRDVLTGQIEPVYPKLSFRSIRPLNAELVLLVSQFVVSGDRTDER